MKIISIPAEGSILYISSTTIMPTSPSYSISGVEEMPDKN
jgi:hypothetical protein